MRPIIRRMARMAALSVLLGASGTSAGWAQESHVGSITGHADAGKKLYRRYCIGCHGPGGDGAGENAPWIDPKPRDFTLAVFKCRSTPSGTLPTDEDLFNAITRGFVTTYMPQWRPLTAQNRTDLVAYIKTFSPKWRTGKAGTAIAIPAEPAPTAESILRGRQLYQRMECWKCHGPAGHGDGPSAATLTDNKDLPIRPYDFSTGTRFMCGTTNEDLYRIFMTGLDGSPMPSFADQLKPAEAWDLVHFLRTLQPIETREAAIWREWLNTHARELKPIGPEGGGR
jgi:mono/diheme cytochrome c family protein